MTVTIVHDGFHGSTTVRLRLAGLAGDRVQLSHTQAKKLARAACSVYGCRCYESLRDACSDWAAYDHYQDDVHLPHIHIPMREPTINLVGHYPQTT